MIVQMGKENLAPTLLRTRAFHHVASTYTIYDIPAKANTFLCQASAVT